MKKIIIATAAVVLLIVIYFGRGVFSSSDAGYNSPIKISTAVAKRGNLILTVNSTGIVEPILTVDLKSKASGEIIELPIEEGDVVSRGKLIAKLDATTTKYAYDQALADLEVAKKSLSLAVKEANRADELFGRELISELDHENALLAKERANSDLVKATASLEDAKERLSDTVIKSPIDGIVLQKFVEKGQIIASGISAVSGGTIIATVADLSRAYVTTAVDEVDIGSIEPGQKAAIIAESYPDREFMGEVQRIHPQASIEQNVTTFNVTIEVDNSERLLMAGMNASVEITAGFVENALLIPREALADMRTIARMIGEGAGSGPPERMRQRPEGSEGGMRNSRQDDDSRKSNPVKMVIVVNSGVEEPRPVELGLSNFEQAEVLSGLSEGDTVLTTMTSKALKDREAFLERMRGWNRLPGQRR
ncbi:MAG: efflux RND transporter periplasmic adaptor subunit [Candidatus Zixiibacteriota bacterium]|nr:MAG: efflux RND transporter periplasmic adaptor subunit [candidate division Zixibacteria bacterium]